MTTIISVLNTQGIAIAADSAATVTSGNIKKVYNKSNKLFTLSKYHPVGIAIYNSLNFEGIPWETIIKMYRKQLGKKKFETIEKYKLDFLSFLSKNLNFISNDFKKSSFYSFCSGDFQNLKLKILNSISENEDITINMSPEDSIAHVSPIISKIINEYKETINSLPKNILMDFSVTKFKEEYNEQLDEIINTLENEIKSKHTIFNLSTSDKEDIRELFYGITKVENIFEQNSGLVFMGFGDKEIYPTSQLVTVGSVINGMIRYKIEEAVSISPGKHDADIIPYAQRDVTMTVLTGVDPNYQNEINSSINTAFKTISSEVGSRISVQEESNKTVKIIEDTSKELIGNLDKYRAETITRPLLNVLNNMGKEDMAEMAESLVSITSLKRKFTPNSSDESVGGPVDVAIITKGDGFIWIKRKNYFDIKLNPRFLENN